jgi:hypothetical protein
MRWGEGNAFMDVFYEMYRPHSSRLMKRPITTSCVVVVLEKQMVQRTKRLIRARTLMCVLWRTAASTRLSRLVDSHRQPQSHRGRGTAVDGECWGVQERSQGLRARGASATMLFELPNTTLFDIYPPHSLNQFPIF